jgi:BarA-like signal transduction histidine kinase
MNGMVFQSESASRFAWLQGKRLALCEQDSVQAQRLIRLLQPFGVQIAHMAHVDEMLADLEQKRYSTVRVYIGVFVTVELALQMEAAWQEVVAMNPSILETPLILMADESEKPMVQHLIDQGVFRYELNRPVSEADFLALLDKLNRWKMRLADKTVKPSAVLSKD